MDDTTTKGNDPMLAYDFPLLGAFWTIAIFALWVIVVFAVIWAFIDNFRRRDHSGWAKAGWALVIIVLPLLGTLIYMVARPVDVVEVAEVVEVADVEAGY